MQATPKVAFAITSEERSPNDRPQFAAAVRRTRCKEQQGLGDASTSEAKYLQSPVRSEARTIDCSFAKTRSRGCKHERSEVFAITSERSETAVCRRTFAYSKIRIFKESKIPFRLTQTILVDTGYTGILKIHQNNPNIQIPKKKTKKNPLTKEDKEKNKEISKKRIVVENVIGKIKRFRILSDKYRCRRKRFELRFNLI